MSADRAVERTVREAYGRLVAILAARRRDIMSAVDALQEAIVAALTQWPVTGIPQRPEAWLISVAQRRLLDGDRRAVLLREAQAYLQVRSSQASGLGTHAQQLPDDRLELMLLCAHPAIDASTRAPLILQTVLGLDAGIIASAFLVPPTTMGQRLVRAKQKIRDSGMRFELPGPEVLEPRLEALLQAIYAAHGIAWEELDQASGRRDLTAEALMLCEAVLTRLPDHPETLGLFALISYTTARREARRNQNGQYVPLSEQDIHRWDRTRIAQAEEALRRAASAHQLGRFQLEAAIQSAHTTARLTGLKDPQGMLMLYEALLRIAPSTGARVAHAVAAAEVHGPAHALELLAQLDAKITDGYQAFHAARADLLRRSGRKDAARDAYRRAIGLCDDAAVRAFLQERLDTVNAG